MYVIYMLYVRLKSGSLGCLRNVISDLAVDDENEVQLTKAILKQAERISDQNRILKQLDQDIEATQTVISLLPQ